MKFYFITKTIKDELLYYRGRGYWTPKRTGVKFYPKKSSVFGALSLIFETSVEPLFRFPEEIYVWRTDYKKLSDKAKCVFVNDGVKYRVNEVEVNLDMDSTIPAQPSKGSGVYSVISEIHDAHNISILEGFNDE